MVFLFYFIHIIEKGKGVEVGGGRRGVYCGADLSLVD